MDGELNSNMTETVKSKEEEARLALQDELPEYVAESFMATGYDTLQVISKMDTSDSPGNSLQELEEFISTELIDDPRFARGITNRSVFKFLPGHRKRIIEFVHQIKFNLNQEKLKHSKKKKLGGSSNKSCVPATTVKKARYESEDPDDVVDQVKAMAMIRQQITKWQRTQSSSKLRELRENVHLEIKVALSKDSTKLIPSILCKVCNKSTTLGFKSGNVLLSNWTRHIVQCVEKQKTPTSKESKIQDFFSPNISRSSSSDYFSAAKPSKVFHDKLSNSIPSCESFPPAETCEVLQDKLPNSNSSCETSSDSETLPQTSEDLQVENTINSDVQVFRKAPPAHL